MKRYDGDVESDLCLTFSVDKEEFGARTTVDLRDGGPSGKVLVCSVDPPGCVDIDDALHAKPLEGGLFEVRDLPRSRRWSP